MSGGSYAFIYDDILNDRTLERVLAAVEVRLTSLGLQGRVSRMALFRSGKDLVESMVHQGVTTCVLVGNDRTLDKMMWFLPDLDLTIGYLPVTGPSLIADLLGIPVGVGACDVLAARLVETIDMGKIDDRYFLSEVVVNNSIAAVDIEGRYRISAIGRGSISVRNLGSGIGGDGPQANAKDGMLEVVMKPQAPVATSRWKRPVAVPETRVLINSGEIISTEPMEVRVDNHVMNGFRFKLGIEPNKLKIITGRSRKLCPGEGGLQKISKAYTLPTA